MISFLGKKKPQQGMKRLLSKLNQTMDAVNKESWRKKNVATWFDVLLLDYDFNLNLDCIQTASLNTLKTQHLWRLVFLFIFLSPLSLTSLLPPAHAFKIVFKASGELYAAVVNLILGFITDSPFHVLYLWFSVSEMGMIIQENNVCGNFKNLRWWVL